jgi:ABC-type nitrate/sulfonate/bicarbonate transport system substrate-binding protein
MNRSMLLGLAGGAALAPLLPAIARADDIPLRMATINIDSGAQPYYALEGGFFKNAG